MGRILNIFTRQKRAAEQEAARLAEIAAHEAAQKAEKQARAAVAEFRGTQSWKRTARFEAGSINIAFISFSAPFGYRGETARVDVRADGIMRARITNDMGENRDFTIPEADHAAMLGVFLKSLSADKPPSVQGMSKAAAHLSHARHAALGEFIQTRLNAVLEKEADPAP